jgi:hypothetical protein
MNISQSLDSISVLENPQIQKPAFPIRIWKKISDTLRGFWRSFQFWKRPMIRLTDKQIKLIDTLKGQPSRYPLSPSKRIATIQHVLPHSHPNNIDPTVTSNQKFDNSLQQMRAVMKDGAGVISDALFNTFMKQDIEDFQKSAKEIPEHLSFIANLAVQLGNKASKPLFRKLQGHRSSLIDPYLKSLKKSLLKTADLSALRQKIEIDLDHRITNMNPPVIFPAGQHLALYSTAILNELFRHHGENESIDIDGQFVNNPNFQSHSPSDSNIIDLVFENTASLLVENKITQLINLLDATFHGDLPGIIQRSLKLNSQKVTDILSCRMAELMTNMEYKPTFDKLAFAIHKHIEKYVSAEQTVDDLIQKAKTPPKGTTPDELQKLQQCRNDLQAMGESNYKQAKILQDFSQDSESCHPLVRQMIPLETQDRSKLEEIDFNAKADELIELFLPSKKEMVNGKLEEIDGLTSIWRQLIMPEEFNVLLAYAKDLFSELIPPEIETPLKALKAPIYKSIESMAITIAYEQIKPHLVDLMRLAYNQIVDPELFKEIIATEVLPSIHESMIPVYEKLLIEENMEKMRVLFTDLCVFSESKERDRQLQTLETITQTLYNLSNEQSKQFKIAPVSYAQFKEAVQPDLKDMQRVFLLYRENEIKENQELIQKLNGILLIKTKAACTVYSNGAKRPDSDARKILSTLAGDVTLVLGDIHLDKKKLILDAIKEKKSLLTASIKLNGAQIHDDAAAAKIYEAILIEVRNKLHGYSTGLASTEQLIKQYNEIPKVPAEAPFYSDLVMNTVFGVGKFQIGVLPSWVVNSGVVQNSLKNKIQEAILGLLGPMRNSHDELISLMTQKLATIFSDPIKIQALLTKITAPKPTPEEVNQTFKKNVGIIATLANDIICKGIDVEFSSLSPIRPIAKAAVGGEEKIYQLITTIFQKMTENRMVNANLVLQSQKIAFSALNEVNDRISKQQGLDRVKQAGEITNSLTNSFVLI